MTFLLSVLLLAQIAIGDPPCPCGYRLSDPGDVYTHYLFNDFSNATPRGNLVPGTGVDWFSDYWMPATHKRVAIAPEKQLDQQFELKNVYIGDGTLVLKIPGYSAADRAARKPVSVAGIQTKFADILYGSFRTEMMIHGPAQGTVATFFWYHGDHSEADIEIITPGTSVKSDTINWTLQPSSASNGTPIPDATLSAPYGRYELFVAHRFDITAHEVRYYQDGVIKHRNSHSIPSQPGSLQAALWSNGDRYWSGDVSPDDVFMSMRTTAAYYNITKSSARFAKWQLQCQEAGGPSEVTICEEGSEEQGKKSKRSMRNLLHMVTHQECLSGANPTLIVTAVSRESPGSMFAPITKPSSSPSRPHRSEGSFIIEASTQSRMVAWYKRVVSWCLAVLPQLLALV